MLCSHIPGNRHKRTVLSHFCASWPAAPVFSHTLLRHLSRYPATGINTPFENRFLRVRGGGGGREGLCYEQIPGPEWGLPLFAIDKCRGGTTMKHTGTINRFCWCILFIMSSA